MPDHAYAASLMEQAAWPFWLRGEARTIHTWVFSLPDAILRARVHLALDAAFRFIDSVNLSTRQGMISDRSKRNAEAFLVA